MNDSITTDDSKIRYSDIFIILIFFYFNLFQSISITFLSIVVKLFHQV